MRGIHFVVLVLVATAIIVVVGITSGKGKGAANAASAPARPASDVQYLPSDVTAEMIIRSGRGGGSPYLDMWIKEPGWQLGIEDVSDADGGMKALRSQISTSNPLYGSIWIAVVVPKDTPFRKLQTVNVSGRIAEVKPFKDGMAGGYTLVIRDATVVGP